MEGFYGPAQKGVYSPSVQFTLFEMAKSAFKRCVQEPLHACMYLCVQGVRVRGYVGPCMSVYMGACMCDLVQSIAQTAKVLLE